MEFRRAVGWAKGHRNALVVAAFVLVLAGLDLFVNRPEGAGVQWFGLPLLAAGLSLLALIFWPTARPGPRAPADTLAQRLLRWATLQGRLVPFFPFFGIAVIVGDVAFNIFFSATSQLLTNDQVVLLFGATLVAYRFVPERYGRERDFVFLFALALVMILIVPLALLRLLTGQPGASVDVYSTYALAPETSWILNLIGIRNEIVLNPAYDGPGISFRTLHGAAPVQVFITSSCSGIYSFAIFAAAFAAFVFTEQRKLTRRVLAFFALGIFLAYLANVLRMVVIVWVGYQYDTPTSDLQSLLFAHGNVGWIIFLAWIALFWFLLFRFLPREAPTAGEKDIVPARRRGVFCGICGIVLTPAVPATRCRCGKMYHTECLAGEGRCPNCAAPAPASPYAAVDHPVA